MSRNLYFDTACGGLAIILAAILSPAQAAEGLVPDVRLGVLAHDVPLLGEQHEHGADLNAELQFASPVPATALDGIGAAYRWLLRPAPHVGIEVNTNGETSQIYLGLTWTVDLDTGGALWPDHSVFLAIGFGPAFNNGRLRSDVDSRLSVGAHILFHPSLELGYRLTPMWSVSAYLDHSSNGGLASQNDGINDLGVRLGINF